MRDFPVFKFPFFVVRFFNYRYIYLKERGAGSPVYSSSEELIIANKANDRNISIHFSIVLERRTCLPCAGRHIYRLVFQVIINVLEGPETFFFQFLLLAEEIPFSSMVSVCLFISLLTRLYHFSSSIFSLFRRMRLS